MIDKIALIKIKDHKILSTLSKGKDTFYLPGGKREEGETDEQTLKREIQEELSVTVKNDTIQYYGTFEAQAHGKIEGTVVKMTCYMAEYEGDLCPASEIEKIVWLTYQDKDKVSLVDKLIFQDLFEKKMIE